MGHVEHRRDPELPAAEGRITIPRNPALQLQQNGGMIDDLVHLSLDEVHSRRWRTVSQSRSREGEHHDLQCGAVLQDLRPENQIEHREKLQPEDPEAFGDFCGGCMLRRS
jgi:hypothetical protein